MKELLQNIHRHIDIEKILKCFRIFRALRLRKILWLNHNANNGRILNGIKNMNDRKYQYRQTSLLIAHSSKSKHDFASGPIISPPEHTHEYPPGVLMHFPPLHGSSKFEHSSISTHRWPSNKSSYPTAQAHENDPKMYLHIKLIETQSWCIYVVLILSSLF